LFKFPDGGYPPVITLRDQKTIEQHHEQ